MASLDLDDMEEGMFEHAASGYGAVVHGGTADDRVSALREQLGGENPITVDGREIDEERDFVLDLLVGAGVSRDDAEDIHNPGSIEVRRALNQTGDRNVLIFEFDSMDADTQKGIAQMMKGVIETSDWEGAIGYTAEAGDAVVTANFDLSGRVKSWSLEE